MSKREYFRHLRARTSEMWLERLSISVMPGYVGDARGEDADEVEGGRKIDEGEWMIDKKLGGPEGMLRGPR